MTRGVGMRLTVTTPDPTVEATRDDRVIRGLALPYGEVGRTSAGPVIVQAGSVSVPADLRRVKLFREHGRTDPVGYATAAQESPAGLSMVFHAANTADGDRALVEASEGVRDALSVELDDVDIAPSGEILSATLTAVALTSVPAFSAARVVAEYTPDDKTEVEDEPTPEPEPEPENEPDAGSGDEEEENVSDDLNPVAPVAATRPRGMSLDAAMRHVVGVAGRSPDANALNAALSDIVPGSDTSDGAFIRPQWVDELWTASANARPYYDSVSKATLTGMTVHGWKWGTKPVVDAYAGNKTEIPSGPVTFGPDSADAVRHAGGWDVDRVFVDLGDGGILTAILQAAALDYAAKQEAYVRTQLLAEATDAATAAGGTVMDGLVALAGALGAVGAAPSFVAVASDLWGEFVNLSTSSAPWWLTGSVDLASGTSSAGGTRFWNDPGLTPGHILGGDRRAATFYEPSGNPFRVQAVNIPNGGVDIGIFGYCAVLVNDPRAVVDVTVTPAVP